jgi:hypothetical protein
MVQPSAVLAHRRQRRVYASRRMRKHDLYDVGVLTIYGQRQISQRPLPNSKTMDFVSRAVRLNSRDTGYTTLFIKLKVVSTDDFAGPLANQTNLALKAILGIRAMGEIASLTGNSNDAKGFIKTSQEYITKWEKYTFNKDSTHAKLAYQLNDSWGLS